MRFILRAGFEKHAEDKPTAPAETPCVVLVHDAWNDFGYYTLFAVYYFDELDERTDLGDTKILHDKAKDTQRIMPTSFEKLDESYCSLGQSLEFYEKATTLLHIELAEEILEALRDVVINPLFAARFKGTEGFTSSLLRFSEAEKAYHEGRKHFGDVPLLKGGFKCTFSCRLEGFDDDHVVELDFTERDAHPNRMLCFVGKNGTGKSGVLARLATQMSGWSKKNNSFMPGRPLFSRTICVSYSVFQPFRVPNVNSTSYRYCGIRSVRESEALPTESKDEDVINLGAFHQRTVAGVAAICEIHRYDEWASLMRLDDLFGDGLTDEIALNDELFEEALSTLSSGQRIVVSIFTDVLQHVEKQSLILIDEPEIYLHPTLLSTMLRLLHQILEEHDCYAIVATHSPIVVQEVPARSVLVFERHGSIPAQGRLSIETLGANLTEVVDCVFAMNDDDKNYKTIFRKLAQQATFEEIMELFDDPELTMNARVFLRSLYRKE